jgi:hypothetical protein
VSLTVLEEPFDRAEFTKEALALVLSRIDAGREDLLRRVAAASDEELARGTDEDWGLGQIAAHLLIVERGIYGIALRLARGEPPGPTGQPRPAPGYGGRARIVELAERVRERRDALLAEFPADPDVTATAKQPYYGPMNCYAWLLASMLHYPAHLEALDRGTKSAL